jgi:hypothetical protein
MTIVGPIGIPERPWGEPERDQWRSWQSRRRSYRDDVVAQLDALGDRFERVAYGEITYAEDTYPLYALRSRVIRPALPTALVTGGVHGYETSGVLGALAFLDQVADTYAERVNLLIVPCVSPWAYERVHRWTYDAVDPNRNFRAGGPLEATALIDLARSFADDYLMHIDLHETTDTDRTEFGPALAARDGTAFVDSETPDGFYLVADSHGRQLEFQQAIIAAVERVTHIAPPDAQGQIIGSPVIARGVIEYPLAQLSLCPSITNARFKTTTEVYPDSPRTTPDICILAQVTAVRAALDFALEHGRTTIA